MRAHTEYTARNRAFVAKVDLVDKLDSGVDSVDNAQDTVEHCIYYPLRDWRRLRKLQHFLTFSMYK